MSKYTITHICGHDHEYQLFGPHKDRDRKQAWLGSVRCPLCKRADEISARRAANEVAAETNRANGAVALTGSEAQIAYAEGIRSRVLRLAATGVTGPDPRAAELAPWLLWLQERPDAAWWIDSYSRLGNTSMGGLTAALDTLHGRRSEPGDLDVAKAYLLAWPGLTTSLAEALQIGADLAALRAATAAADTAAARRAEHQAARPARPAWLQALREEHGERYWNGKIYSGGRIYVANQERRLGPAEEKELRDYLAAFATWAEKSKQLQS